MATARNSKHPSHHTVGNHSDIVLKRLSLLPPNGKMRDLPKELWHKSYLRTGDKKNGGPNIRMLRLSPDRPSNTVTAYIFNKFVHPKEHRYLTPREAARLQGFHDAYEFAGPVTSVQKQVGNAVPVQLANAIAQHVHAYLKEIVEANAFSAVSLFSGAGGMDIGFHKNFDIVSCVEFDRNCCETLRMNFPKVNVIEGDIKKIQSKEMSRNKKIHLVFGGPPCQSFSAAGKQRGFSDPRGELILEYTRVIRETKPEVFVMENVPGMKGINKGKVVELIVEGFDSIGYKTEVEILCAADYGAPQMRKRLIFIGRKKKYKKPIGFPPPTHGKAEDLFGLKPYVGVLDAINDLPKPLGR